LVIKRNGTYEPFDRVKLLTSMRVACGKRPVTLGQIENALSEIEWSILEGAHEEVSTALLGEKIMDALKALDEIAYVRYASVYRRFKDVGELMAEMQSLVTQDAETQSVANVQGEYQAGLLTENVATK